MKRKNFFRAKCLYITVGFVLCTTNFDQPVNNFISFQSQRNNTQELMQQFYDCQANKRPTDLKLEPIREEIKYPEHLGGYYFYSSSNISTENSNTYFSRLTELQNQKLKLENKKEEYDTVKSKIEAYS